MLVDYVTLAVVGMFIGLSVSAPIGAVNLICIRRALEHGQVNGLVAGLGSVLGDGIFAVIAAFGLHAARSAIMSQEHLLGAVGGLVLIGMGVFSFFREPPEESKLKRAQMVSNWTDDLPHAFGSTLFLTLTNPATMLGFAVFFASLQEFFGAINLVGSWILVLAVMCGSTLWWFGITFVASQFHGRLDRDHFSLVNKIFGALIAAFGFAVWISLLFY